MNVMITGAQFSNKGAQSLLFSVIDQLRKRYNDVEIYYLPLDDYNKYNKQDLKFNVIYSGDEALAYSKNCFNDMKLIVKNIIKIIMRKPHIPLNDIRKYNKILPYMDVLIDVSGYQLSSKWSIRINKRFLQYIENAKMYNIPVILMPQSFGPFDYGDNQEEMDKAISTILKKVDLLFVREMDGYNLLKYKYNLTNIRLSADLVLQTPGVDWRNIYNNEPEITYPILPTQNNVGIIPNFQTQIHGDSKLTFDVYEKIICHLLDKGKKIYIFRHSKDLEMCEQIYSRFTENSNVVLIKDEISCLAYCEFIKQFDFIVASRFHAVVHSYKQYVPVLILGWAVKYQELAKMFNQEKFVFDLTNIDEKSITHLIAALDDLAHNYRKERENIQKKMMLIQRNTCFDQCRTILDKLYLER